MKNNQLFSIDSKMIESADRWASYIQRRGWIPLNTLKMIVECLFWGFMISVCLDRPLVYVITPLGAASLSYGYYNWKEAVGYWNDVRKMQRLNATAMLFRSKVPIWRILIVCLMSISIIIDVIVLHIKGIPVCILAISINYLSCCTYLGPGDFAKDKKEKRENIPQEI